MHVRSTYCRLVTQHLWAILIRISRCKVAAVNLEKHLPLTAPRLAFVDSDTIVEWGGHNDREEHTTTGRVMDF